MLDTYHFHFHGADTKKVLDRLDTLERTIMSSQADLAVALDAATAKVTKIGGETRKLLTKIQELTDAIANGGPVTPEVEAKLAALNEQLGIVDGLVDDEPPVDPTEPATP